MNTYFIAFLSLSFLLTFQEALIFQGLMIFKTTVSSNKNIDRDLITFEYKDYKDNSKIKEMTITDEEFIRRFLIVYRFNSSRLAS